MKKILVNKEQSVPVNPGMIGLFFEDINYNLDGGLNAEMIENYNFEALFAWGGWNDYHTKEDYLYGWSVWPVDGACELSIATEKPQNPVNIHFLRADFKEAGAGFTNQAYDGIYMNAGEEYIVSFWARSECYDEDIQVKVFAGDEEIVGGDTFIIDDGSWNQYFISLIPGKEVEKGQFVVTTSKEGVIDFDCISMIPANAVYGIFRKDLADKLKELKPGFLRFPGGCIIEGNTLDNRYQWKKSIGPKESRKFNWNRWAVHGTEEKNGYVSKFPHYGQTLAVGYFEYFLLCEYLETKPLPVLNVGLACQYQSTELVEMDDPQFQTFIQDALDLIEFANGSVDTTWGKKRAMMGHPAPFNLELLGIGNEQWQTDKVDFFARYEAFEKAIHEVYPEMKLIGSAGPDVLTERYDAAWNWVRKAAEGKDNFVYAMDEHYYVRPQWLYDKVHFYDEYPRHVKVFAGEYAAHIENLWKIDPPAGNTFEAALSEAAFLTGVERNADVVIMASYAPLMARVGWSQWCPDLIWFDGKTSYETPSYYVQQLYSKYMGEISYAVETEGEDLYASATKKGETLILKAINHTAEEVKVKLETGVELPKKVHAIVMTGEEASYNSIENPDLIRPEEVILTVEDGCVVLPAESFVVILVEDKLR